VSEEITAGRIDSEQHEEILLPESEDCYVDLGGES